MACSGTALLVRKARKGDRWKRWEENSKTDPNISELHFGDRCAGNCLGKVESILREGYELFIPPNENADHETDVLNECVISTVRFRSSVRFFSINMDSALHVYMQLNGISVVTS
jgi:hypothetical protein